MINRTNYTAPFHRMRDTAPWWWWLALAWFTLVLLVSTTYLLATIQGQPPVSPRDGGGESRPQTAPVGESGLRSQVSEAERRAAGVLVTSRSGERGSPSARSAPSPSPLDAALDYLEAAPPTPAPPPASPETPAPVTIQVGGGAGLPEPWRTLAECESGLNPRAVNPAGYYGLFQFSLPTWASVGGTGNPIDATVEEQLQRAITLQARSGWGQWPVCAAGF